MTPAQHYDEAERNLRVAEYVLDHPDEYGDEPDARRWAHDSAIATAHVHAILSQSPTRRP